MPPEESADDDDLWKVPTRPQVPVAPADDPPSEEHQIGRPGVATTRPRRSAAPILALVLMGFAHVIPVLASGRVWARNDYGASVIPAFAMLTGRTPFFGAPSWAPQVFGGAPLEVLAAMPRYPLNLFAYLLDPMHAAAVFVGLHLAIAAVNAWFFTRRVAGTTRSAALVGAMVYAFGGALWLRGMHPDYLAVAAWMPAVLRATWDVCAAESPERRRKFAAMLAVVTGLTLSIGGGAPIVMLTVLATIVVMFDGLAERASAGVSRLRGLRDAWPWLAAAVGAGILLSAPGSFPFLEVLMDGARGRLSVAESSAFALAPPAWGRVVVPEIGAHWPWPYQVEPWVYFGILTLPLALLATLRDARGRKLALWTIAALVAAIGILGPIHWVLYYVMPGYSLLRAPARWVIVAALAAGGLAARGLDALLVDPKTRRSAWILAGAMGVAAVAAALAPSPDAQLRRGLVFLAANAAIAAAWLFGAGRAATQPGANGLRFVAGAAAVVLGVDLAGAVMRTPVDDPPSALDAPEVFAVAAREAGRSRLFHDDEVGPRPLANGGRWGYRNARGYSQAVPSSVSTLFDLGSFPRVRFTAWPERLDPRLLRLLGVGVYVGTERAAPPPGFSMKPFFAKDGFAAWKALEAPFDTAVVSDVVIAPSRELEAGSAIAIDLASVAAVPHDVGLPARVPGTKPSPAGSATLERGEDGVLRAHVSAERDALLVIGEGHHRRWRASVNGVATPTVRADAIWIGVRVRAGESDVELHVAAAVRWWMWSLSLGGVAGVAFLAKPVVLDSLRAKASEKTS